MARTMRTDVMAPPMSPYMITIRRICSPWVLG
jgi:hypothetical protein